MKHIKILKEDIELARKMSNNMGALNNSITKGQGNIIGNPIEPVIKLTANPKTAVSMKEHVDLDVSKILKREMNMDQAGDELIKTTIRTASGRLTCAETLGHKEFIMTKLYRSA